MDNLDDKPRSSVAIQFRTNQPLSDIYTLWNDKPAVDAGSVKKDIFHLVIRGLKNVDFGVKDIATCLASGVVGNLRMEVDDSGNPVAYEDLTACATADKSIGW